MMSRDCASISRRARSGSLAGVGAMSESRRCHGGGEPLSTTSQIDSGRQTDVHGAAQVPELDNRKSEKPRECQRSSKPSQQRRHRVGRRLELGALTARTAGPGSLRAPSNCGAGAAAAAGAGRSSSNCGPGVTAAAGAGCCAALIAGSGQRVVTVDCEVSAVCAASPEGTVSDGGGLAFA